MTSVVAGAMVLLTSWLPAAADDVRDAQWHLNLLKAPQAHRLSQGEGIVVAVIDTGVDAEHPDLRGSVLPGADFTQGNQGAIGHTDDDGHGTGVAGLIAAHGRALGIAPKALILPVRHASNRFGLDSHLEQAVEWAIDHGSRVICIASAGDDTTQLRAAVQRALANDIVVVAGVGNYPIASSVRYPAAYPGVVAAAGVDRSGQHAAISAEGPEVSLAAPAVNILSTSRRGPEFTGYGYGTGTSDATAIIAGAVALVRARYPDLSAAEVVHRLTATADDKGLPGHDHKYGYGVVNLVRALTAYVPPLLTSKPPPTTQHAAPPNEPIDIPWLLVISAIALASALTILVVAYARRRDGGREGFDPVPYDTE